jgi:hypothetical protein
MVSTCKEHDKTLHVHTEGWEERLKKTFEISYNYDDVNVDKMNPEQRLLWSLFGRREKDKNPTDAIIDFIKSELKQRDKEWGEAIQELNKNLFKNNGK